MHRKTSKLILLALVVLALILPYAVASAQGPVTGDKVIFGDSYTLQTGETLDGNLTVLGGNVTLEAGSTITGDVTVFGSNVSAAGAIEGNLVVIGGNGLAAGDIEGDLVVIGGNLTLQSSAVVAGDVNTVGGNLEQVPGSTIKGEVVKGFQFDGTNGIHIPGIPALPFFRPGEPPEINITPLLPNDAPGGWLLRYFLHGLSAVAWAALMAVLGVLVAVLLPQQGGRVTTTVRESPLVSFGTGCLTSVLGIPILLLLAITICLLPLALILSLLLVVAALFGWVAVGWALGQKAMQALRTQSPTPLIEVVVGVVLLTLLWQMPRVIPCLGWFVSWGIGLVAGSIGLGAVLLTRFGTRSYPAAPGGGPLVPATAMPQGGMPPGAPALPEPSQPALPEHSDSSL